MYSEAPRQGANPSIIRQSLNESESECPESPEPIHPTFSSWRCSGSLCSSLIMLFCCLVIDQLVNILCEIWIQPSINLETIQSCQVYDQVSVEIPKELNTGPSHETVLIKSMIKLTSVGKRWKKFFLCFNKNAKQKVMLKVNKYFARNQQISLPYLCALLIIHCCSIFL